MRFKCKRFISHSGICAFRNTDNNASFSHREAAALLTAFLLICVLLLLSRVDRLSLVTRPSTLIVWHLCISSVYHPPLSILGLYCLLYLLLWLEKCIASLESRIELIDRINRKTDALRNWPISRRLDQCCEVRRCLAAAAERTSSELCGLIAALEDHFILRPLSHSRPGLPRVLASLILVSCPSI